LYIINIFVSPNTTKDRERERERKRERERERDWLEDSQRDIKTSTQIDRKTDKWSD
jgi:hypothetical protein